MRAFLIAALIPALISFGGCAAQDSKEEPAPKVEETVAKPTDPDNLPAPAPAEATIRLGVDDDGKTIPAKAGDVISIALVGVPTAGYLWQVDAAPVFLTRGEDTGGPTTEAQKQPGFTGGNHWEVTTFTVTGKGKGAIKLAQRRPWEKNEPPSRTFTVTVNAQ